jgi:hypothetical protein
MLKQFKIKQISYLLFTVNIINVPIGIIQPFLSAWISDKFSCIKTFINLRGFLKPRRFIYMPITKGLLFVIYFRFEQVK